MEIDPDQLECVKEYAAATGRTTADCIKEALDDWIRTVAATISQTEIFNIQAMI